jgi:hypothetical protein
MLPGQHAYFTDWKIGLTAAIVEAVVQHFENGPGRPQLSACSG